ncbi:MAG: hypothetical protein LIO60_00690 [Oscillospiraceae bacterium]|nr:hypothetical protein [Oscillospiraceae bacterium]
MREKLANRRAADDCCTLCQSHCPYTALRCELGRTTARIRGKLPSEAR